MTKKYRFLCAIVLFGLLCQGCVKKDEPNDVEEMETTVQTVDTDTTDSPESTASLIQPGIGVGRVKFGMSFTEVKDVLGTPDFDVRGIVHVYSDLGIQILLRDDKVNGILQQMAAV